MLNGCTFPSIIQKMSVDSLCHVRWLFCFHQEYLKNHIVGFLWWISCNPHGKPPLDMWDSNHWWYTKLILELELYKQITFTSCCIRENISSFFFIFETLFLLHPLLFRWICEMEGSQLKRESASDPNFMRTLERAIRVGEPVLLEVSKILMRFDV